MNERYEIRGVLAEGGLGTVYRCWDRNLDREVAIKRVRASGDGIGAASTASLLKEARTLSTLQHPNIVTVYDAGEDDQGPFIVMELVKGETLDDIISRGALTERDFDQLAAQTLEGLIAAHALGLIHLDLKPENLMITWHASGKFQVKILDFGIAKNCQQPVTQEEDEKGAVLGSIFFMAPEQFERAALDQRTDLYALGAIFYFALTQQYPFQGETGPQVMVSHLYHRMVPLAEMRPDLPVALCQWVQVFINRRPSDRWPSATQALETLPRDLEPPTTQSAVVAPVARAVPEIATASPAEPVTVFEPAPAPPVVKKRTLATPPARSAMATAAPPLARPAAIPPPPPSIRQGMPRWAVFTLPPLVVLILIFGVLRVMQFLHEKERQERFADLVAAEKPQASDLDVRMLFSFLESPNTTAAAATALMKIEGGDYIDAMIRDHLDKTKSVEARANLLKVAGLREITSATPEVIRELSSPQENVRKSAWTALGMIARPEHVPDLLEKMASSKEPDWAAQAIADTAKRDGAHDKSAAAIVAAYRSGLGGAAYRASLLKILGQIGGPKALDILSEAARAPEAELRKAAVTTLGLWPENDALTVLAACVPVETDAAIRLIGLTSATNLAATSGRLPQSEIFAIAKGFYDGARDQREKDQAMAVVARVIAEEAAAFFDALAVTEPQRKSQAEATSKRIREAVARVIPVAGETVLRAEAAEYFRGGGLSLRDGVLANWLSVSDFASWDVRFDAAGTFDVSITQACTAGKTGRYETVIAGIRHETSAVKTSASDDFKSFLIGKMQIAKPGIYRLWLRPVEIPEHEALFRLKSLQITPAGS